MTTETVPTEFITHTLDGVQRWRQVAWIGLATDRICGLHDEACVRSDPAGFRPLWVFLDNEMPVPPTPEADKGSPHDR